MYLGPEFEKDSFGLITPGPHAKGNMNPGIGKQVDSVKVTAPRATFGKGARTIILDGMERRTQPWDDPDAPGPHQYHATQRFSPTIGPRSKTRGGGGGTRGGGTRGGGGGGETAGGGGGGGGTPSSSRRPVLHSIRPSTTR